MRGSPSKNELFEVPDDLSARIKRRKVHTSICIVGGTATALAFDRTRTTHDIDGRIDEGPDALGRRRSTRPEAPGYGKFVLILGAGSRL